MRGLSWGVRWRDGRRNGSVVRSRERSTRQEAVHDAPLRQIVGRHLDLHAVTGKNAHAVNAHASRQMTEELVILRLVTRYADSEGGIGECFQHNADELDDILGHKGNE